MTKPKLGDTYKHPSFYLWSCVALVLLRGLLNGFIPLMDKTEARYAEIARIMAETGNWVTLQIDYGFPFWAKPPLSTWLSAMSIELLGVSEFSVRLPYLLLSIALVFLVGKYAHRIHLPFYLPGFILLTIPEFLLHAGVVSTDTALAFCVALVMLSFWETTMGSKKWYWEYLIFAGVGLGLLAKGPIILILSGPPLLAWMIYYKRFWKDFISLPWILGILITALISFPWYYLAEVRTPGFIDYFVVGEHFSRYFDSSWTGDKYGFPKSQPLGMIWIFLLVFAVPWIIYAIKFLWKQRKEILKDQWVTFLLLWLIWTPLFFTISSSLIHPYIMPIMVPIALLVTHYWTSIKNKKQALIISFIFPGLVVIAGIVALFGDTLSYHSNTDKYLIKSAVVVNDQGNICHLNEKSYSSQFYSKGAIKNIDIDNLKSKMVSNESLQIIMRLSEYDKLEAALQRQLKIISNNRKKGIYTLKSD